MKNMKVKAEVIRKDLNDLTWQFWGKNECKNMYKRLFYFGQTQEETKERTRKALDKFEQQIIVI